VRPHIEDLAARADERNLERFWSLLEQVAQSGSASERDDLFSTLEEFDLKQHQRWLGSALKTLTADL
jgi:hypothetical protein